MPNWCNNDITISGCKKELTEFLTAVGFFNKPEEFKFGGLLPMPEELTQIHTGYADVDGVSTNHWREVEGKQIAITQEEFDTLIEKCGATDWYEWANKYWGTKWEPVDVEYYSDIQEYGDGQAEIRLSFSTAWGPPEAFYEYAVAKFPNLSFNWFYKEEGMQIAGWLGA